MFACLLIPELELLAARRGGCEKRLNAPAALAPTPGGTAVIGQASPEARGFGIRVGMRLEEALARCPELELVPPDPLAASEAWEGVLSGLEGIGAAAQPGVPGEAYFEVEGLLGLHRDLTGLGEAALGAIDRLYASSSLHASSSPARLAVAASPFAARLAAGLKRSRDPEIAVEHHYPSGLARFVTERKTGELLAPLSIHSLHHALPDPAGRADGERALVGLIPSLERLGLKTLGSLATLDPAMVADRFGHPGLRARRLARGESEPLRPRTSEDALEAELELPESLDGALLAGALELLVDRLLALPGRQGRSIRSLSLSATLIGGGSWRAEAAFNVPTASPETIRLVLAHHLAGLPGPASSLALRTGELGGEAIEQGRLGGEDRSERRERLGEAIRQTRVAAGPDSLLRVLTLDPDSRLPERRAALSPRGSEPPPRSRP